jgi:PAS domain S-box-containing protein
MNLKSNSLRYSKLTFFSRAIGVLSLVIGLIALLGWLLEIEYLKIIVPGYVAMKANAALGFVLAGTSLFFLHPSHFPQRRWPVVAFALPVCLLGLFTFLDYLLHWNLGLDQLLWQQVPADFINTPAGRMSSVTALIFFLLGLALLLLSSKQERSKAVAQGITLLAALFALIGIIGYLFNLYPLYQITAFSSMALHTAVTAELLCLGILLAQPEQGLMAHITSPNSGGVMARRMLPFLILIPVLIGWFRLWGQNAGIYDTFFGLMLMVVLFIFTFGLIVWLNAISLNRIDLARGRAEQELRASEERLRLATEATRMGTWDRDLKGGGLFWSPSMERLMGYEPGTFPGTFEAFSELVHPEDWSVLTTAQQKARSNGGHYQAELRFILRDGRIRWGLVYGRMLFDAQGQPNRLVGIDLDITENKLAEQSLRESEARHRAVTETASDAIITIDAENTIVFANQAAQQIFGYSAEDLLGQSLTKLIPTYLRDQHETSLKRYTETGERHISWQRLEFPGLHRSGQEIPLEISFGEFKRGGQLFFTGIMRDITERKQADRALRKSQQLLDAIINNSTAVVYVKDVQGRYLLTNRRYEELFQVTREAIIGKTDHDLFAKEHADAYRAFDLRVLAARTPLTAEEVALLNGEIHTYISIKCPLYDEAGDPYAVCGISTDITELKRAEQVMKESQARLAGIISSARDAIITIDEEQRITLFNAAAEKMFGYQAEEVIGQSLGPLLPERFRQAHQGHILDFSRTNVSRRSMGLLGEIYGLRCNGEEFPIEASISQLEVNGRKVFTVILRDITERLQSEAALRESEARFRLMVEGIRDYAIFMLDQTGRVATWNDGAQKLKGYEAEEIIGQHYSIFYLPEDKSAGVPERNLKVAAAEGRCEDEGWRLRKDGSLFWVNTVITAVHNEAGELVGFSKITRDLTERRQVEEDLRKSEEHFRIIFGGAGVGNVECDAVTGRFLLVNQKMCEITGYSVEELLTLNFNDITYPADRVQSFALYQRFVNQEIPHYSVEKRYVRKDGSLVWVQASSTLLCDTAGNPWRTVAVIQNIDERKRAEAALRESEYNLATAQRIAHIGSWIAEVSETGELTSLAWSEEAFRIFGYEPQSLTITHEEFFRRVHPDDRASIERAMEAALKENVPYALEHRIILADGGVRILYEQAEVIRDSQTGKALKVVGTVQDITERRRVEEEIRLLNAGLEERVALRTDELAAANRELEAFAYSVSHDLRAPLRAIDGFSRILLEDYAADLSPDAEEYLHLVRSNTQQMGHLIDDLLSFSRLNRQPLKKHRVQMEALVRQVLSELQHEQEGRDVIIKLSNLPDCFADSALLKQVLVNLLTNALKFTAQCEKAVIEIGWQDSELEGIGPVYFVKDNGVGFDMKYDHKLFKVFQRLHRAEDYEGTGVGLAIVQRIIQRHGGRVWAEGALNQGATFFFTLEGGITT